MPGANLKHWQQESLLFSLYSCLLHTNSYDGIDAEDAEKWHTGYYICSGLLLAQYFEKCQCLLITVTPVGYFPVKI
jgi:hypothetical protein